MTTCEQKKGDGDDNYSNVAVWDIVKLLIIIIVSYRSVHGGDDGNDEDET